MKNDEGETTALRFHDGLSQVKSWVSECLFRLAATDCGATTHFPDQGQDIDAVDCLLSIQGIAHSVQLKSTSDDTRVTNNGIRIDLKPRWKHSWNILSKNGQRVFIVVYQLTDDPADWIDFRDDAAVAEHRAYWIEWDPATHNERQSILIPFDQPFDTWTIIEWASHIDLGFGE